MQKLFFGALVACAAATFVGCGNSTPKADLKTDVEMCIRDRGANAQARRAALAHLVFNVFGVIWVLCLFYPFVKGPSLCTCHCNTCVAPDVRAVLLLSLIHICRVICGFFVFPTVLLSYRRFIPQITRLLLSFYLFGPGSVSYTHRCV